MLLISILGLLGMILYRYKQDSQGLGTCRGSVEGSASPVVADSLCAGYSK